MATIQRPLTHRQTGPSLILVLPSAPVPSLPASGFFLDPLPQQKWAEEGFLVAALTSKDQDVKQGLEQCLEALMLAPELERKDRIGLIGGEQLPVALEFAQTNLAIAGVAAYAAFPPSHSVPKPPLLVHLTSASSFPPSDSITTHKYPSVQAHFVIPGQPSYDKPAATLAHQRTLVFLREALGGPYFDLEAIWEEHTLYEFGERAVEKTMATMVAEPYVNHVPTLTGGIGRDALTKFYATHFIPRNPASMALKLVSRTVGPDRIVDEMIVEFVHDCEIDWMLPGVPPTGKAVSVPLVAVVNVRGDKLYHEHIYWDQASVLVQIGLLPARLAFPPGSGAGLAGMEVELPVAGREQADKMLDPVGVRSNTLIEAAAKGR